MYVAKVVQFFNLPQNDKAPTKSWPGLQRVLFSTSIVASGRKLLCQVSWNFI